MMIKPMLFLTAALLAAPAFAQMAAPAEMPMCSAKVTDGCMQTKAQQARAMSGAQADARDAKTGMWTPNGGTSDKDAAAPMKKMTHHMAKKKVTTTTTMEAAPK
jgi:hypothetical protein